MKYIRKIPLLFCQLSYSHQSVQMTYDIIYFKAFELQLQLIVGKVIQVKSYFQRRTVQNSTLTFRAVTLLLRRCVLKFNKFELTVLTTTVRDEFIMVLPVLQSHGQK